MQKLPVSVSIVTFNSERYIGACLEAVLSQDPAPAEIVVVDNASTDSTRAILEGFGNRVRFVSNTSNRGFCGGQNQAIGLTSCPWVLVLNPDVVVRPGFLASLYQAGELDPSVGVVCGKLRLLNSDLSEPAQPKLDSTGVYFNAQMRHFDRGWGEPDDGRYGRREYVFGATGAAALYRRAMIDDISIEGSFFDDSFFAYREDADVAWRAQLFAWRCLYTPEAVAGHVRHVRPGASRRAIPAAINMHSVKNRFLMRVKNLTPGVWRSCRWRTLWRDALVVAGCLLWEPSSLPAFGRFLRALPQALRHRSLILKRRRVEDSDIACWFVGTEAQEYSTPAVAQIAVRRS